MNDPIADMLTRIRNGALARQRTVQIPHSRLKEEIARILAREGWLEQIETAKTAGAFPMLVIRLKYGDDGKPVIRQLRRVSKPGRRAYVKRNEIPNVLSGYGIAVLSTSAGLMTNREARKRHLGGEVLCEIS